MAYDQVLEEALELEVEQRLIKLGEKEEVVDMVVVVGELALGEESAVELLLLD